MKKTTYLKTLLVALCICLGSMSAWAEVTETYTFASWVKAAGADQQSFTFSASASAKVNNTDCYTYTSALNGNSLGNRFAVSNTHKKSGLLDHVWFRLRNNSETDSYTGLFVGASRSTYFAILNLVEGDKVTITFNNNPNGNLFYSSNATYDNSGTPTAIVSGTTQPVSGKEYTITSNGHLGLYLVQYSAIKTVSITRNITSYTTRMATAKSSGTSLSSSVMRTSVKTALTSALGSEYVDMASASITSSNIDAYISALETLETAVANAQTSANDFAILNNLISKANTFAETVTSYEAPSGAETVYTSDANVNPVALAAAVRAEVIEEGVKNDDTDITAIIANSSFELGNTFGWTTVASDDTGAKRNDNATYTTTGADGDYLFNTWQIGTPIKQNIGTLPAGQYKLSCLVASNGGTIYLTMNDSHNAGKKTAEDGAGSFVDAEYTFTLASDTEVTIGAVGGDGDGNYTAEGFWWYKADKFTLTYVGQDELALAKTSLEAEIETATALKDSWTPKVGTVPFKYDATYYNALVTKITSANTVLNSGSETVSEYTTAESDLETAESNIASSTLNLPASDKYYRLYLANAGASTGKNLKMLGISSGSTVLTEVPYPVKFVAKEDNYIIENPYDYYVATSREGNSNWGTYKELTEIDDNEIDAALQPTSMHVNANVWKVEVQEDGTFKLLNQQATWKGWGWNLGAWSTDEGALVSPYDSSRDKASRDKPTYNTWICSEAVDITDVTLSVNATAGWGTFIAPYDNLTPSTVKAYTVSHKSGSTLLLEENTTGILSANTPYILSTEEASDQSASFKGIANNDKDNYEENGLIGLLTAGSVPVGSYILQHNNSLTAFYKTTKGITGTANRCYLNLSSVPSEPSAAREFIAFNIYDDETTGIVNSKLSMMNANQEFFDLQGRKVAQPSKGLYIMNGRKVVIK